jgi:hypothetical protein
MQALFDPNLIGYRCIKEMREAIMEELSGGPLRMFVLV